MACAAAERIGDVNAENDVDICLTAVFVTDKLTLLVFAEKVGDFHLCKTYGNNGVSQRHCLCLGRVLRHKGYAFQV